MQLYEKITIPQLSYSVMRRGNLPSASLKLVFSPEIRTFATEHICHGAQTVIQNEDDRVS